MSQYKIMANSPENSEANSSGKTLSRSQYIGAMTRNVPPIKNR